MEKRIYIKGGAIIQSEMMYKVESWHYFCKKSVFMFPHCFYLTFLAHIIDLFC